MILHVVLVVLFMSGKISVRLTIIIPETVRPECRRDYYQPYPRTAVFDGEVNCQCGRIGTTVQTQFTAVRDHRFYLNINNPAPCSGTVMRWNFCYYRPLSTSEMSYRAIAAVYRPRRNSSDGSVHYQRITDRVYNIVRGGSPIRNNPNRVFECRNPNPPDFDIQAGDVLGACIFEPADTNRQTRGQLDIVGEASGYSLLEMNDVSGCTTSTIPSDISRSQLSIVNSRILYLYADIASKCILDLTLI